MTHLYRPNPATEKQLERLRELAAWPGMPPEAVEYVEGKIAEELDVWEAMDLLRAMGKRIRTLDADE